MGYRKTYKLLILWIIGFLVTIFVIGLQNWNSDVIIRSIYVFGAFAVAGLLYIIYQTGYVYWMNGISYEDALEAGEDRRKQYAWKHVSIFGRFAFVYLLYTMFACLFHWSIWIDTPVFVISIIISAVWTMKYKL